ncbi:MAG: NB-ARC domain-containing protein [Candidatus Promineifilaceae bacterium]
MHLDDLRTAVPKALRAWSNLAGTADNLLTQLLIVQHELSSANGSSPTSRLATNQVLLNGIQLLQRQDPTGAKILSLRFMDAETVLMVASKLNLSEDQVKRRQRDAIRRLTQILWEQETAVRAQRAHQLQAQLMPADYSQLFGLDQCEEQLLAQLQPGNAPWVIAIVGLGGIGKTALADHAARQIIAQFAYEQVVWLQVTPAQNRPPDETLDNLLAQLAEKLCPDLSPQAAALQRNSQLRQTLKSAPYLVVVDNLEREADVALMAGVLHDLANPGKFLLTSRVRPPVAALSLTLAELSSADTIALIRHQARIAGLPGLAAAPDDDLAKIYEVTGGNPLAVKLVVGLTAVYPLPRLLTDLKEAKTREIEQLYRRIYWQVWRSLSPPGQTLLEMMPMTAGMGATPEQLQAMSGLDESALWIAIGELVNRSLLEVRGTAWERRYTIHRLTESFLYTEIIRWPGEEGKW